MKTQNIENLLQGEITQKELVEEIFNTLGKQLLDKKEIVLNFEKVTFISVYFLERLEQFVFRARDLNVNVQLCNVQPSIYKVFQVAKSKVILEFCT